MTAIVDPQLRSLVGALEAGRRRRRRRRLVAVGILAVVTAALLAASLMLGRTIYPADEVIAVLLGQSVPGASFTVGELRLPRAVLGVLVGVAFGIAGITFQTMLRNPLASPDIIGITHGASAAAVIGIVVLSLSDTAVSFLALAGALVTALAIYLLSVKNGFAGSRLILIGIGVSAMLQSAVAYVLSRAAAWDLQTAMQWLSGSLNGASWDRVAPLAIAFAVLLPVIALGFRDLEALRFGDDTAAMLGVRVTPVRVGLILAAVALLAFATAASGPIAFLAFFAGPIAARLAGPGPAPVVAAGLVGASLVLASDLLGQFAFENRLPVGVVTGILGAPYLVLLLARLNRSGGSL